MNLRQALNRKGITLVEMLVALVIFGLSSVAIYRVFVGQSRAYVVQEQIADVQQNVRGAAEILTRDLRMAGYKNDKTAVSVNRPIFPGNYGLNVMDAVRIEYEQENRNPIPNTLNTIIYFRNVNGQVIRELYINNLLNSSDVFLDNVMALNFSFGLDMDAGGEYDGVVDQWVSAANVNNRRVISVQFVLTAWAEAINPDLDKTSPRSLTSRVALRNPMVRHIRDRL